jgi:hypothetical protein
MPTGFEEVSVESDGNAIILAHSREEALVQAIAMGTSTALFVLFVIIVLPALQLTRTGQGIWMIVGLALLAGVGLVTQVRTRSTRIRIDAAGLQIDQGTPIDREHIAIAWGEIAGSELEPVNPKDGRKGMQLRIQLREGEPVDTLVNVGVGDLTEARRTILDRWHQHRLRTAGTVGTTQKA